jgi:hypothetical protein
MMALVVTPIASFTVPIAVVIMMPVTIIPVVIPMILVSRRGERGSDNGCKYGKSFGKHSEFIEMKELVATTLSSERLRRFI